MNTPLLSWIYTFWARKQVKGNRLVVISFLGWELYFGCDCTSVWGAHSEFLGCMLIWSRQFWTCWDCACSCTPFIRRIKLVNNITYSRAWQECNTTKRVQDEVVSKFGYTSGSQSKPYTSIQYPVHFTNYANAKEQIKRAGHDFPECFTAIGIGKPSCGTIHWPGVTQGGHHPVLYKQHLASMSGQWVQGETLALTLSILHVL
jgi:hypothetical protein